MYGIQEDPRLEYIMGKTSNIVAMVMVLTDLTPNLPGFCIKNPEAEDSSGRRGFRHEWN